MRLPSLVLRDTWYYYQLRIPADIQHHFACSQLKRSLRTKSYRQAVTLAKIAISNHERAFFMIRSGLLTPQMIEKIVNEVKEGLLDLHRKNGRKLGDNLTERYQNNVADLTDQIKRRDYSAIAEEVRTQLEHRNITADNNSPEFLLLCDGLLQTKRRVYEVMSEREGGNLNNRYDTGLTMRAKDPQFRLSALMKDYKTVYRGGWRVRTKKRKEGNFKKVLEVLGDVCTSDIDKDMIQHLRGELECYPVNRDKNPYKGRSLEECRMLKTFAALLPSTLKDVWVDVKSLLIFAVENEKYKVNRNYAGDRAFQISRKGQTASRAKRAVYDQNDIGCLFTGLSQELYVKQPHRYWIPLIGLYQGMRLNEICQLYIDDLVTVSGIDCIRITDNPDRNQRIEAETNLKSVKNAQSCRTIPIHPTLIDLGLMDFIGERRKRGNKRLWEDLKTPAVDYYDKQGNYSHYVSKWYCGTFRKNHIVTDPELKPFHSLRHTFIDWHFQHDREMDFTAVKGLVGHIDSTEQRMLGALFSAVTWQTYAKEMNVVRLMETLSKIDYGVDLALLKRK